MSGTLGSPRLVSALALSSTLLVLLLTAWAATIGPQEAVGGSGPDRTRAVPTAVLEDESSAGAGTDLPGSTPPGTDEPSTPLVVQLVPLLVVALVCASGGFLILLVTRTLAGRSTARARGRMTTESRALDAPDRDTFAQALAAGAEVQRRVLLASTPRNAIVECWHRFEVEADRTGRSRQPWETSSELVERLLAEGGADEEAVRGLAAAFRAARFGTRPVTEQDRDAALLLLDRIHRATLPIGGAER